MIQPGTRVEDTTLTTSIRLLDNCLRHAAGQRLRINTLTGSQETWRITLGKIGRFRCSAPSLLSLQVAGIAEGLDRLRDEETNLNLRITVTNTRTRLGAIRPTFNQHLELSS